MTDTTLRIPVPSSGGALSARRSAGGRAQALRRGLRAVSPASLARFVWAAVWLPYWFGSDVPAPALPARNPKPPAAIGLAGEQVVRTLDRIARRIWLNWTLNVLVRGAWLGGVVGIGWLVVELLGGPEFPPKVLLPVGIGFFAGGLLFAALIRPSRKRTARMLDRSFRLHERMTTAIENLGRDVPPPGVRAQIVYLQMADAANVVAELRRHPAFGVRPPLREVVLALACVLLLAALYFLRGVGGGIPDVTPAGVPAFTSAASQPRPEQPIANPAITAPEGENAPSSAEVQQRAARSNEARRDLATLGDALDNQASTYPAAEAIARGDYDQAADELRDLAANVESMSPEAREELANDLDAAADQMSDGSSELAQATRDAASGLRGSDESAQQGLSELGDAVQETGEEVISQQELANQMAAARAAESSSATGQSGDQGQSGQQSQSGESGETGGESESGQTSTDQNEAGQSQGQAGQSGEAGSESQQSGSSGAQQSPADRGNNPGQAQSQGQGEQRGRLNRSAQPGQPGVSQTGAGQPGQEGAGDQQGGEEGASPDGGSAQQGGGAGAGDGEDQAGSEQQGAAPTGDEYMNGEGIPAEARTTTADPNGEGEPAGDPRAAETAIQLDNSDGGGLQTSNNAGSSSEGSGTGSWQASGDTTQQPVGEAGPDSNRVPAEYRDVVENYFSDEHS